MKKSIILKSISLLNFKGIKNLNIEFKESTFVFGDNGTGKTTIFDAFTWLLFGKDSSDRKDFELKTLDENNVVIPKVNHEVSAILIIDGEQVEVKRTLKENWVKKRGSSEPEFTGNSTEYYWNGVPMQQKEFQIKVSGIMNEVIFKMITNPMAFNSMKWQDRRNILLSMAPVDESAIVNGNSEFQKLLNDSKSYKDLSEYQKMILNSIKKAKEDIKEIPVRIAEVERGKPDPEDFESLSIELSDKQRLLDDIESKISDSNLAFQAKLDEQKDLKIKINNLKSDIQIIENNSRREAENRTKPDTSVLDGLVREKDSIEKNIQALNIGLKSLLERKPFLEKQISTIQSMIEEKRQEWHNENAKEFVFDESNCFCPTCQTEFSADKVNSKREDLKDSFLRNKKNNLDSISAKGSSLSSEKKNAENELLQINQRIESDEKDLENYNNQLLAIIYTIDYENDRSKETSADHLDVVYESILSLNTNYESKKQELKELESKLVDIPAVDNQALVSEKNTLKNDIDGLKNRLAVKEIIEKADERIKQLSNQEKELSDQILSVEKTQFLIEQFNKTRIEALEKSVNEKFQFVKFKMFETQINGGESECCEALINGVPFSDANTASKINAGLDIINTLCSFYGVNAPIFIDNRESIVSLIPSESQIINLVVSEPDKKIRVE